MSKSSREKHVFDSCKNCTKFFTTGHIYLYLDLKVHDLLLMGIDAVYGLRKLINLNEPYPQNKVFELNSYKP